MPESTRRADPPVRSGRGALSGARTIVLKIGSKSLSGDAWTRLAEQVSWLREHRPRARLVVVSSGAIALGMQKLGLRTRPKDMARLQAAAAAGQSVLMQRYEESFGARGLMVAQVLLTHADLADRTRANNARDALAALLDAGAVPVINENDAVAVEEIKFGDNDQLSAMVVPLVDADLLILLSDVEGLLDRDGVRIPVVRDPTTEAYPLAGKSTSGVGTGGMISKVQAAERATLAGAHVLVASAKEERVLERVLGGEDLGTLFVPKGARLAARKHWIAFALRPRGALVLDAGAVDAVKRGTRSVLAVGVLGARGAFDAGDPVSLVGPDGVEVARGLSRMGVAAVAAKAGARGKGDELVVVHLDDLVVL